jgi:predicted permease
MSTLINDVKYGIRQLLKNPGFTVVAVLSLALGIGANTAVFSVVDNVLLRALPYSQPEQLVRLSILRSSGRSGSVSYPYFEDWRDQSGSFSNMAAYKGRKMDFIYHGLPESLEGVSVSQGFFDTLGISAAMGRTFAADEDEPGANSVVVISHSLWSRCLGKDPEALGKTILLDETNYTIIGVLPRYFQFSVLEDAECWIPLTDRLPRTKYTYQIIGRLKPGVTLIQCRTEMKNISERLTQVYPKQTAGPAQVERLSDYITGRSRLYLLVLLGAITFVLLIACVNVANLILARSTTRNKEIAVRQALGAGSWRITRQILTENLLLALMGGAAGVLVALWLSNIMKAFFTSIYVPRAGQIALDVRVLGFTFVLSLATGLLIGLVPVFRLRYCNLNDPLKNRSSRNTRRNRMSDVLVVFEISSALILLIGAVLMMQTFRNLIKEDPGFNTDKLLTFKVELPSSRYPNDEQREAFCRQALQKLAAIPGVHGAAMDSFMPFGRRQTKNTVSLCGFPESSRRYLDASIHIVTPSCFNILQLPCIQGRLLTEYDELSGTKIVVINRTMAQLAWPDENPIGHHIMMGGRQTDDLENAHEVIGVVANAHHGSLSEEIDPSVYFLYSAMASERNLGFILRTNTGPLSLIPSVRSAIWELDSALPISELNTMNERIANTLSRQRFSLTFFGIAGSVAMILVAVGVYGVVSFLVGQRRQELGIRMALGAQKRHILLMILRKGLLLVVTGSIFGIAGALGLTRFLSAGLYGVSSTDPVTFLMAPLLLSAVTLLACYVPARRATKIDPMEALRYE